MGLGHGGRRAHRSPESLRVWAAHFPAPVPRVTPKHPKPQGQTGVTVTMTEAGRQVRGKKAGG